MEKEIWKELETYYTKNGLGYICCFPAHTYSHQIYYYDEIYQDNDCVQKIVDYSYNLFIKNGYKPDLYEIQLICSSSLVYPLRINGFISCFYLLDQKKYVVVDCILNINHNDNNNNNNNVNILNGMNIDMDDNYEGRIIFVCLHKN